MAQVVEHLPRPWVQIPNTTKKKKTQSKTKQKLALNCLKEKHFKHKDTQKLTKGWKIFQITLIKKADVLILLDKIGNKAKCTSRNKQIST
jgi:hypothetical protein